jgi:hypothetical protein
VLQPGKASAFAAGVTSDRAIAFGRTISRRFDVVWAAAGFADAGLDDLVEIMLRTLACGAEPGPRRTNRGLDKMFGFDVRRILNRCKICSHCVPTYRFGPGSLARS